MNRFSRPVRSSSTAACCPASPIAARTRPGSLSTSCPATRAVPASGRSSVASTRTTVVLPAPFGPSSAHTPPRGTLRSTQRSACTGSARLLPAGAALAGAALGGAAPARAAPARAAPKDFRSPSASIAIIASTSCVFRINYVHSTSYAVRSCSRGWLIREYRRPGGHGLRLRIVRAPPRSRSRARAITARRTGRMPAARPADGAPRRRGPRPRHTRQDVALAAVAIADADGVDKVTFRAVAARLGVGVMSLYNYVPDKQALVYDMVAEAAAELRLPEPTGDWRADMHGLAREQRALLHRHPWLVTESSHLQPLGPTVLAPIEWALGVLEPTGLPAPERLETIALFNWFVGDVVRGELAARAAPPPDSERAVAQARQLGELLATGRYPRFAAAVAQSRPPDPDAPPYFDRLLDRILDGLIGVRTAEDAG